MSALACCASARLYAHGIYLDVDDHRALAQSGAAIAVSPTSNLFLGSGFFDYATARAGGVRLGLASDVGGGMKLQPLRHHAGGLHGRPGGGAGRWSAQNGVSLSPFDLWWQHTAGAARALGLGAWWGRSRPAVRRISSSSTPAATPLLARRTAQAESLAEWLFALIMLADDRAVTEVVVAQEPGTQIFTGGASAVHAEPPPLR